MKHHFALITSVRNSTMKLLGVLLFVGLGIAPTRATETVLHSFDANYINGAYPVGQLTLAGSTFYGVTQYGVNGYGSIFTMTTAGLVKTIHEFAGGTADGYCPNAGLVAAGGNFYGTTLYGGTANAGIVYDVTPTGTVTILHSFTGYNSTTPSQSDGAYPYAGLLLASDGKLYGATYQGGSANQGTVFSIKKDGTGYLLLYNFNSATGIAYYPVTGLAESSTGVLYGACSTYTGFSGGLYKLNTDGSGFTAIQGFSSTAPTGYNPSSDLVKATDGNLYGFCANGGAYGFGTVFKIVPGATDTVTTLWDFDGYTGASPNFSDGGDYSQNRLLIGADKNLYGVTREGGTHGYGTAFKLTLAGVCTRLTSFNSTDTNGATNPLAQSGSSFYATSYFGGTTAATVSANGDGAAVSISSAGALKVIQSFYILDGFNAAGNLVQVGSGAAAAFYGVTSSGGAFGDGVIFKINSAGAFSVIHHINNYLQEGYSPESGLLLGRDGFLYGTTTDGGLYDFGTIFKVSTAGKLTVIHRFQSVEGHAPSCALVQGIGTDTNLYGACSDGEAAAAMGSVFSTNTTGTTFTVLHYFGGPDGAYPSCQLLPDGNGNLYGTTYNGGANGLGTIFKVSTSGATFTTLFDFYYSEASGTFPAGYNPNYNGLMVLNGGFLYGVAEVGGANDNGVIFKCNVATGATTSLHDFNNSIGEGTIPVGGLCYDSTSGTFYGVTLDGGTNGATSGFGVIYAVNATTGALSVLHTLTGNNASDPPASDGAAPYGGVILGTDGFLYGTTSSGGAADVGTVFKQTP